MDFTCLTHSFAAGFDEAYLPVVAAYKWQCVSVGRVPSRLWADTLASLIVRGTLQVVEYL